MPAISKLSPKMSFGMLNKATAKKPSIQLKELMAFAMSSERVEEEYAEYFNNPFRHLYLFENEAFIGIELKKDAGCEIRHIAVDSNRRKKGIGVSMIEEVAGMNGIQQIFAETDQDAVGFYQQIGFHIKSLGEKYPGRERFYCAKTFPSK